VKRRAGAYMVAARYGLCISAGYLVGLAGGGLVEQNRPAWYVLAGIAFVGLVLVFRRGRSSVQVAAANAVAVANARAEAFAAAAATATAVVNVNGQELAGDREAMLARDAALHYLLSQHRDPSLPTPSVPSGVLSPKIIGAGDPL